jgi:tetratricopeptide (TPR) repeat protein
LEWGRRLRTSFQNHLPEYVEALELVDEPELYPLHADFYSRLALTFEHGDYARLDAIPGRAELAGKLYHKALAYHPDARAYLGLGIQYQKAGSYADSIDLLKRGLAHFPSDPQLNICLGVSYLNMNQFKAALDQLQPYERQDHVLPFLFECCRRLGLEEQAETYRRRMEELEADNS